MVIVVIKSNRMHPSKIKITNQTLFQEHINGNQVPGGIKILEHCPGIINVEKLGPPLNKESYVGNVMQLSSRYEYLCISIWCWSLSPAFPSSFVLHLVMPWS
jgi:hypothetical protein